MLNDGNIFVKFKRNHLARRDNDNLNLPLTLRQSQRKRLQPRYNHRVTKFTMNILEDKNAFDPAIANIAVQISGEPHSTRLRTRAYLIHDTAWFLALEVYTPRCMVVFFKNILPAQIRNCAANGCINSLKVSTNNVYNRSPRIQAFNQ